MRPSYRAEYAKYKRYFRQITQTYNTRPEVRVSVEVLLTLIAISFFGLAALKPTLATVGQLNSEIKTKEEVAAKLNQKIEALNQAQQNISQKQDQLALLDQALSTEPAPEIFLRQIEGLVVKHGVSLSAVGIEEIILAGEAKAQTVTSKEEGPTNFVRMSLAVSSPNYQGLHNFLVDLENLIIPIKVRTLTFSLSERGTEGPTLNLALSVNIPYLKTQK